MSGRWTVPSSTATARAPTTSSAPAASTPNTGEPAGADSSVTLTMATTDRPSPEAVVPSPGWAAASVAYPATDRSPSSLPPSRLPLTPW